MGLNLVAWLIGSKLGRYIAIGAIVALSIIWVLYTARKSGIKSEQARQIGKSLKNLRNRIRTDDEISRLGHAARLERLRQWSR